MKQTDKANIREIQKKITEHLHICEFYTIFAENYDYLRAEYGFAYRIISHWFLSKTPLDRSAHGWARRTFALSIRVGENGDER